MHTPPPLTHTLANGVQILALPMPHLRSACVSVFVRTGSAHESPALNGICHVLEHMVFKGTATRDARAINLDAERLGAEVNAHTDKDHTAFHMRGMAQHAGTFVQMLAELVATPTFPAADLEHERQVLLHECTEDEDDPLSTAFKLFDKACFGSHPAAQAVIGRRRNIERFTRDELLAWREREYTGPNVVVGVAGAVDAEAFARQAEAAFAGLPAGRRNAVKPAAYVRHRGGVLTRQQAGGSQAHAVLGFASPPMGADDPAPALAAALFGEGMSSPLLDQIREQRGLAYYTACSADVLEVCGQFVVEASTTAAQVDELLAEVMRLLRQQAERILPLDLERARQQLAVRRLRNHERPMRRLEDAALELMVHGQVRSYEATMQSLQEVSAEQVRQTFEQMLARGACVALAGTLRRGAGQRAREIIA
jgi:predicted Zn-dependent peptidase